MQARASASSSAFDLRRLVGLAPLVIFVSMLVYIGLNVPSFLTWESIQLVLKQSAPVVIVCLGLSAVVMAGGDDVVSGGIDLSIPATAILSAGIIAQQLTLAETPLLIAAVLALGASLVVGAINGFLVTRVGMTPLLASLAMFVAVVGVNNVITSSRRIDVDEPLILFLRDDQIAGLPSSVAVTVVVAIILIFLIHWTKWGANLQAVGGSRDAAEVSGLRPNHFLFWSFVLAAVTGFVASFFVLARGSGSSPGSEDNLMLEMVLATFLGASFSSRRVVTVWGAVLGAVLVAALSTGFKSMGVNVFWTGLIKGSLILIVVALGVISARAR